MSGPCDLERLVLLLYPDELTAEEAAELRSHLVLCERCAEVSAELEAVAEQLDLVPDRRLEPAERRELLARILAATLEREDDSDVRAALDLVDLSPELDADAAASLRDAVLQRTGLGAEADFADAPEARDPYADVTRALALVPAPALSEDARAALREAVWSRVGLAPAGPDWSDAPGAAQPYREVAAALDRVTAPELELDEAAALREAVLARAGLAAELEAELDPAVASALEHVPAPNPSAAERAALRQAVLERVGIAAPAPQKASAPRRGLLLRLPAWSYAAAAALLLSAGAALLLLPPQGPSGPEQAFLSAEKLVRTARPDDELLLAAAREQIERTVLAGGQGPEARRAKRELVALDALHLRAEPGSAGQDIRPTPLRSSPEDFLRPKREVLERFPDSLAALYVLKGYAGLCAQRSAPVAAPSAPEAGRVEASLAADLSALRAQDALSLELDVVELDRRFSPAVARAARQALWIQRGLHAERAERIAEAQAWYHQVVQDDAGTRASELAQERLAALSAR